MGTVGNILADDSEIGQRHLDVQGWKWVNEQLGWNMANECGRDEVIEEEVEEEQWFVDDDDGDSGFGGAPEEEEIVNVLLYLSQRGDGRDENKDGEQ